MSDQSNFEEWLISSLGYKINSARDVVSRLKRVERFISLSTAMPVDELLFRLGQNEEFRSLSVSVKSQLKKAVKLHFQFCNHKTI